MLRLDPYELAQRLDETWSILDPDDFERNNVLRLVCGDSEPIIVAVIPVARPLLVIYGTIGVATSEHGLTWALEKMDFWTGLEGPAIGLRRDTRELTATQVTAFIDEQVEMLPKTLAGFVETLRGLQQEFDALPDDHGQADRGLKV